MGAIVRGNLAGGPDCLKEERSCAGKGTTHSPKTERGKRISSQNAITHGIYSGALTHRRWPQAGPIDGL